MPKKKRVDLYRGHDPRTIPAYDVPVVSRYLRIPENTIRNWAFGSLCLKMPFGRENVPISLIRAICDEGIENIDSESLFTPNSSFCNIDK